MARKRICVDFDGVIHSYTSPWIKAHVIPDPPVEGAIEWLSQMIQKFDVVIFSTRCKAWRGRRAVRRWLYKHSGQWLWYESGMGHRGIEEIQCSYKKLPGLIYLDDRAVRFEGPGTYPTTKEIYQKYIPWNKE